MNKEDVLKNAFIGMPFAISEKSNCFNDFHNGIGFLFENNYTSIRDNSVCLLNKQNYREATRTYLINKEHVLPYKPTFKAGDKVAFFPMYADYWTYEDGKPIEFTVKSRDGDATLIYDSDHEDYIPISNTWLYLIEKAPTTEKSSEVQKGAYNENKSSV